MLILYSLGLSLVLIVGAPWWLFRMATSGRYREGLPERLGRVPARMRARLHRIRPSSAPVVWVHAVSVGEVLAASRLVDELTQRLAAIGGDVFLSTTTRTGQKLARERFGEDRVFYFPLDFAFAVRAWLRALRPGVLVLAETEFWPRVLVECRRAGVRVAVVNARISDRSWPRYRRLARLWRPLLGGLSAVLAQSELDAERLRAIGAAQVRVGGNLKFDVRAAPSLCITERLRQHLPSGSPVLVCGSTLAGEEELLLDAVPPGVITVLAPRHPERFADVAQLLARRGVPWARRSRWIEAPAPVEPGSVFLLDSVGELASVYSLASAAFIGGSLVPAGGHNPLEPAQFSVPVLMGPSYENFRGIVEALLAREAIRIASPPELKASLAALLPPSEAARAMGRRGREVFEREAGATARAVEAILALLEPPA